MTKLQDVLKLASLYRKGLISKEMFINIVNQLYGKYTLKLASLYRNGHISKEMFTDIVNQLYGKKEVKRVTFNKFAYVKTYEIGSSLEDGKMTKLQIVLKHVALHEKGHISKEMFTDIVNNLYGKYTLKLASLYRNGHISKEMFTDIVNQLYGKKEVKTYKIGSSLRPTK